MKYPGKHLKNRNEMHWVYNENHNEMPGYVMKNHNEMWRVCNEKPQ